MSKMRHNEFYKYQNKLIVKGGGCYNKNGKKNEKKTQKKLANHKISLKLI